MLTLSLRQTSPIPLEVEGLLPEKLAGLTVAAIEQWPVAHGNRTERLAKWFDVSGDASDMALTLEGDCGFVKRIGERMTAGTIVIEGNAGTHAGAMMAGGTLRVTGDAGDWLGAEMTGGRIAVAGSAGHQTGAAYRGSRRGMSGGAITIEGNVGDECGLLLRRGLIAVGGAAGMFCGASLIAGTIVAAKGVGPRVAAGMKRGTVVVGGPEPDWPPGVAFACGYAPAFAGVLFQHLRGLGFAHLPPGIVSVRCHRGDLVTGGKGEIWWLP
jgi:formylmethanofuran dehydrogenase subunit C